MAKPNNSIKTIQTPDGTDHEIVPEKMASGSYYADLDTLSADGKILSVTPITASSFTIQGQSVGLYRTTQTTTLYGKNSSDFLISNVYTNSIIKISRIESGTTYWTLYGDDYVTALVEGTTTSSTSTMFTTSADTQAIKNAYLKNATVSGSTLTITKQDNSTITFTGGGGGGGSVDIDNTSITENSSNQIQTVGVIDQKTGNANKQWTGTKAEYDALGTHDANTFYNITDDASENVLETYFTGGISSGSTSTAQWSYTFPTLYKTSANGITFSNNKIIIEKSGRYLITFYASRTVGSGGNGLVVYKNNSNTIMSSVINLTVMNDSINGVFDLSANDYLQFGYYTDAATTVSISANNRGIISIVRVG